MINNVSKRVNHAYKLLYKSDTKTVEELSEKIEPKSTKVRAIQILKLPKHRYFFLAGGD